MAIKFKSTGKKYNYKGYKCTVFSPPALGENFDLLLSEAVEHGKKLGKKEIILLNMNDIPLELPSDFAVCDKSQPDCLLIIIDPKKAYPFYLAHELVHLLPWFYDIDKWGILKIAGKPVESWPLFAKCIRKIEHFLSDIHVDVEVIRRGFSIEEHFLEQLSWALPVFKFDGEYVFDFYDRLRLATNYWQTRYQLDTALKHGPVSALFKEELNRIETKIAQDWPTSFILAYVIGDLIAKEGFLQGFNRSKFEKIGGKSMVMLHFAGVPSPTPNF